MLVDGRPAGRLYVDRTAARIQIVDIALLPEHRDAGVGGRLLRQLLAEAAESGLPVSLHVTTHNPAQRLYARLGFVPLAGDEVYLEMVKLP